MSLLELPVGHKASLAEMNERLRAKLLRYGLHEGDCIRLLRRAPLGGPVLIEANDREIALGRTVAAVIQVENECASR